MMGVSPCQLLPRSRFPALFFCTAQNFLRQKTLVAESMVSCLQLAHETTCTERALHKDPGSSLTGRRRERAAQSKPVFRNSSASPLGAAARSCESLQCIVSSVLLHPSRSGSHAPKGMCVALCAILLEPQTNPGCHELHKAAASQPLCGRQNNDQRECIARTAPPPGAGTAPRAWREERSFEENISMHTHAEKQGIAPHFRVHDGILSYLSIPS